MKAFVYTKEPKPKKIAVIMDVCDVYTHDDDMIHIVTRTGAHFSYYTKIYKTTIYQN